MNCLIFVLSVVELMSRFQTQRYDSCCDLYKELCAHELKYDFSEDDQNYVFLIDAVLKLPMTAAVVKALTRTQIMKMVRVDLFHWPEIS
jgi:hypothetical protein